jgi:hypothetical protein
VSTGNNSSAQSAYRTLSLPQRGPASPWGSPELFLNEGTLPSPFLAAQPEAHGRQKGSNLTRSGQ